MSSLGKDWREQVVHYERRVVEHGIDAVNPDETRQSYSNVRGLYIANVILKDGEVVKVLLDRISLQGEDSKEKYDSYGIKRVSSINKDWWEQVAYYEDWVLKNGIDAVKYDKDGHAENVDLISGATIGIDDLTLAVKDALSR